MTRDEEDALDRGVKAVERQSRILAVAAAIVVVAATVVVGTLIVAVFILK